MTCDEYRTLLAEANSALHSLQLGGKVKMVRIGEKVIEYSAANSGELRAYVAMLQRKVDACDGVTAVRRGPVHFMPTDS